MSPESTTAGSRRRPVFKPFRLLRTQDGFALILALGMLAILSILGAMVLTSSRSELGISGNYQSSQEALYAADRAVEFASSRSVLLSPSLDSVPSSIALANYDTTINAGGAGTLETGGTVENLGVGKMPTSLQTSFGSDFGACYYLIKATGEGPDQQTKARVESTIVRLFKVDDTIFETTKGG